MRRSGAHLARSTRALAPLLFMLCLFGLAAAPLASPHVGRAAGWITVPAGEIDSTTGRWPTGDEFSVLAAPDADSDGCPTAQDCDDTNPDVYPGAPQVCDGVNNDCDDPDWPTLLTWSTRTISGEATPVSIVAADVDGDGDADVLSASSGGREVAWHENELGDGSVWTERVIGTLSSSPRSVFAADIDGDGDVDLLSASYSAVEWHENLAGDGSAWASHAIDSEVVGADAAFVADVDGDGDLDAVAASGYEDTIAWYENLLGDGAIWAEHLIAITSDYPASLFAEDVDGDGDIDLLAAKAYDDTIVWYENEAGDGSSWAEQLISNSVEYPYSVFAADLDGDGDPDALSASMADDTVAWHENAMGDGSVWHTRSIAEVSGAMTVFAADLDGDGDIDALSASLYALEWHENLAGDGSIWEEHTILWPINVGRDIAAADLNGDGKTDALSTLPDEDRLVWHEQESTESDDDGDGLAECDGDCDDSLVDCTVDCTDADGDGLAWCAGDCNDDNWYCRTDCTDDDSDGYCVVYDCDDSHPDCALNCVDGDDDGFPVCAGDCDNGDPEIHPDVVEEWPLCEDGLDNDCDGLEDWNDPGCPYPWTDSDSDGHTVYEDCDDSNATVHPGAPELCDGVRNDCDDPDWPTLVAMDTRLVSTEIEDPRSVSAADLDGDGDLDVVSCGYYDNYVYWHENLLGDGSVWTRHPIEAGVSSPTAVFPADLDGDGDPDVLSAAGGNGTIAWHENLSGDGSAWTEHEIEPPGIEDFQARSVFAADVDGDGDIDVLSAIQSVYGVAAWHENLLGDGSAWTKRGISAQSNMKSVVAGDVDGDGDLDALSTDQGGNGVTWHENILGDGSEWTVHCISCVVAAFVSVVAADVDGDGDVDALATSMGDDKLAWYENSAGDGSEWSETEISLAFDGVSPLWAGDLDGDGDVDALSGSFNDDTIAWHENTAGDGSAWAAHVISTTASSVISVFAADLDGDGDTDALSAAPFLNTVAWHRHTRLEFDNDGDGWVECDGDCDDDDNLLWSVPGEVTGLTLDGDRQTVTWVAPVEPGGAADPLYDTLRSDSATGFLIDATCVESGDGGDTLAVDTDLPPSGILFHYLVRATNGCGAGSGGESSFGIERELSVCP